MGNKFNVKMEGCGFDSKGENCSGYTECNIDKYKIGKVFFYEFGVKRQNVCYVVSGLAKCSHGSTYVCTRNVAMGMLFQLSVESEFIVNIFRMVLPCFETNMCPCG